MTQEAQPMPQTIIHISRIESDTSIGEAGFKREKDAFYALAVQNDNFDDHVFVHSFIQRILRVYLRQIIQICSELITNVLDVTL